MNLLESQRPASGVAATETRIIVAAALVLSAIRILYETRGCYFFSDDFLNFIIAKDMGPTWRYFVRDAQGELIPLYRAINIIYFHLFGLAFWPFRILLVVFQWSAILLIAGLAGRRSLRPAVLLPILMLMSCSPIFDTPYQWWSAAINVLTEALASLIAICLMAGTSALTARQKYSATLAYVTGTLFFPKALFVAGILLGIRLFAALERGEPRMRAFRVASWDVAPIVLAGCAYTGVVLLGGYGLHTGPPLSVVIRYIWHGWNHGFLTGVFGLDRSFFGRVPLANLAIAALIGISLWKRPNAVVLWAGFAIYFVAALGTTAVNRAAVFGIESSEWGRYYADIFCFAIALFVIAGRAAGAPGRTVSHRWLIWPSAICSIAGAGYLLLAASRVPVLWFVPPMRVAEFVRNLSFTTAQATANARVEDGVVPDWVMPAWTYPLNHYHYFLLLFPAHITAVPAANAQFRLSEDGRLVMRPNH